MPGLTRAKANSLSKEIAVNEDRTACVAIEVHDYYTTATIND